MTISVCSFLALLTLPLRTRRSLQFEILSLRHQLAVYQRSGTKLRLKPFAPTSLWVSLQLAIWGVQGQS
ncbi:MAG: hypothetical protein WCP21_03060 [Armatimonadota bacterium]